MALLERLQILIDADAKGAQREFQNIGRTADKELGKAEDRIGRTSARLQSMGSAAAIGGGAVLVGLGMLAKSADEADRQVLKLENSIKNSDQAFRNNGQSLQDLAQDLQKVTAADGDAIIGAQSLLVQFGATEAQIGKLTPLVVDLSQKMGISLEAAAKAVGKSLDGSGGALKKMGINVDETALKTDAATATFDALNQTVGGFARVEGATFSGQLQILKNNVGDLGEAVGSGAAGVLGSLAGQAAGAAGALNELNPGILTAAGGLGTTAALAVTLGGGFAVAAGKALEMRDTLRPIGDDGARSLSKVGKAAAGIAIVGAVVGIVETVATVANSVNDIDSKLAAGTDKFRGSLTGTNAEMGRAFAGLVEIEDKSAEFSGIWEGFGAKVSLGDFTADIEEVEKAFSSTLDTFGPAAAQRVLDDLKRQNEGLAKSSDQYKTNNDFIRASQKQVDARSEAVVQATVAEKAATKAQEAAIAAEEERQSTMQAVTDGLTLYDAKVKLFTATMGAADAAGRGFSESIDASSRLDDQASSALKLAEASEYLGFIVGFLPKEYDLATLALGGYTD